MAFVAIGLVSCNSSKSESTDSATPEVTDSTVATDSVAPADSVQAPEAAPAAEVNPEEALSLEVVKKNLKFKPESEEKSGSWTVKVTNNGTSEIKGDQYVVAYQEMVEECVGADGFRDVTKKRTVKGQDVAPGQSVTLELKAGRGCQNFKNPKIKAVK